MIIMRYPLLHEPHFLIGKLDLSTTQTTTHYTSKQNVWLFYHIRKGIYLTNSHSPLNYGIYLIDFLKETPSKEDVTKALLKLQQLGIDEDRELEEL